MSINLVLGNLPNIVYSLATMSELHIPAPKQVVRLHEQPNFPNEDLTQANKEVLMHTLKSEAGIDAVADHLTRHQLYLYMVAMRGLARLGEFSPSTKAGLDAFTRGFAGFEAISSLVHKPRLYPAANAVTRVSKYLGITQSPQLEPSDEFEDEIYKLLDDEAEKEQREISWLVQDYDSAELPSQMQNYMHDVEAQYKIIPEQLGNTFEVLVSSAIAHSETQAQIKARLAGAGLALALETDI